MPVCFRRKWPLRCMTVRVTEPAGGNNILSRDKPTFRRCQQVLCGALEPTRTTFGNRIGLLEALRRSGPHRLATIEASSALLGAFFSSDFRNSVRHFTPWFRYKSRTGCEGLSALHRHCHYWVSALVLPHEQGQIGKPPNWVTFRIFRVDITSTTVNWKSEGFGGGKGNKRTHCGHPTDFPR